jgi:hypothetical protein
MLEKKAVIKNLCDFIVLHICRPHIEGSISYTDKCIAEQHCNAVINLTDTDVVSILNSYKELNFNRKKSPSLWSGKILTLMELSRKEEDISSECSSSLISGDYPSHLYTAAALCSITLVQVRPLSCEDVLSIGLAKPLSTFASDTAGFGHIEGSWGLFQSSSDSNSVLYDNGKPISTFRKTAIGDVFNITFARRSGRAWLSVNKDELKIEFTIPEDDSEKENEMILGGSLLTSIKVIDFKVYF